MQIVGAGLQAFLKEQGGDLLPPFKQRFPWLGADLQTVRNSFSRNKPVVEMHNRLYAPLESGEAISVAVTEPQIPSVQKSLVLIHGLGGNEDSHYMKETALAFSQLGWHVFRMNARGVGPSRETSKPPYSAGLTKDLRAVLSAVHKHHPENKVYAMGFSLGGQLLLRTLGEGALPVDLIAGVSVSAPLDLSASQQKLERRRNGVYVDYLVKNMRADLEGTKSPTHDIALEDIKTIRGFDEYIIGPYFGFEGADDYYSGISCKSVIADIKQPVLAIHSADDPWIPVEDYRDANWPSDVAAGAAVLPKGGHVGFHCKYADTPWYIGAAQQFFAAI